jgi:MATE family multidrug resistance protein
MYGNLGFPTLGLEGAGWASALAMTTMFALLGSYVRLSAALRRYRVFAGIRRPDGPHLKRLFRLGWPIGVNFGLEAGLFLAATLLVGQFGAAALAAHQVALNAASVTFMVPLGIGMAGTVRVGQAVGRGDGAGAARAGWAAIGMGATFMLGAALLFWLRPEWVVWLYTGQGGGEGVAPETVELAALLLGVAAVFQLFDGTQATAAGALRGLKDTRVPMLIGGFSYWVVGMSAAVGLGFGLELGAVGVWWGLTLGLAAAAVLLTARFRRRVLGVHAAALAAVSGRP